MNPHAAVGSGRKRQPWRIREELDLRGVTQMQIARDLGVTHPIVSRTVRGMMNNRRVLRALLEHGVPARYLALPDDMQGAA